MNTFTTTLLIWRDTTRVGNFHLFWFVGFLFRRVLSVPFCYFPCFVATITAAFVLLKEGNQFTLTDLPQEKVLSLLTNTKQILLCNKIPNLTVIRGGSRGSQGTPLRTYGNINYRYFKIMIDNLHISVIFGFTQNIACLFSI